MPKTKDIKEEWHFVDAKGKVLGKLATEVSVQLVGKNTPTYTPGALSGNHVVVTNAAKVAVTGNKRQDKTYYRHSNYPGGLKAETFAEIIAKNPPKAIELAVRGMLPINKLRKRYMAHLHVYAGTEHPHSAQEKVKK